MFLQLVLRQWSSYVFLYFAFTYSLIAHGAFLEFMFRSCASLLGLRIFVRQLWQSWWYAALGAPMAPLSPGAGTINPAHRSPLRGLPAPLLGISPLFSRGQGRLRVELFTSQLSVWKRLQMFTVLSFFLLLLGAARAFARPVFKCLKKKGKKSGLWTASFFFFSPAKSTK